MNGKTQEIGTITLKPHKKDKLLIVGLGSIGKKYRLIAKNISIIKNFFFFKT
jgi:hypothetical protein